MLAAWRTASESVSAKRKSIATGIGEARDVSQNLTVCLIGHAAASLHRTSAKAMSICSYRGRSATIATCR